MRVPAAKFKATCLELMDRVEKTGEPVVITRRGKPVAQLVAAPDAKKRPRSIFGCMKGTILWSAPDDAILSTGQRWNVDRSG